MNQAAESPASVEPGLALTALTALGIVYGDIGTSPLYALRECFGGSHAVAPTHDNVLGVLSLIFRALMIVISLKYLLFVMRADNSGEGGILALMSLVTPERHGRLSPRTRLVVLGLFGAALLYGDGMITPAISVLSAVEGLAVATPIFEPYLVPLTIVVLLALFLVQHRGTAAVGAVFGPVTLVWFLVLGVLGGVSIAEHPQVLLAVNPVYGVEFFLRNGLLAFFVLGAVFLVVTGGEALYADMGHVGRRPIQLTWFLLVLPALLLNYFGQGALLMSDPGAAENPFYRLVPSWGLYPMVLLATGATIIASQAVITGAFSLTRQAVQLGYSPRVAIEHTSPHEVGQIYVPIVNWTLAVTTIGLVLGFGSSSKLAAAYGVAVTTTMLITTMLAFVVARERWGWSTAAAASVTGVFLIVDLVFFGANILKVAQGGWFALLVAALVYIVMSTWKQGRRLMAQRLRDASIPIEKLMAEIEAAPPVRVPGTAVFMTGSLEGAPPALTHNLRYNKVLHEAVVLLTIVTEEIPRVPPDDRLIIEPLDHNMYRLVGRYGFMENPNVLEVLGRAGAAGVPIDVDEAIFFLGREMLVATRRPGMAIWRERLFVLTSRNARRATDFFRLPSDRIVELAVRVEL